MGKTNRRKMAWLKRKRRVGLKVHGTGERPRLTIYRSLNHMYAQVIDDLEGNTLASASTQSVKVSGHGGNVEAAKAVGQALAEAAKSKGIETVVFDRNGYLYQGRVKALAEAARKAGLRF